jgi:hydrogenase 3 maturation protease
MYGLLTAEIRNLFKLESGITLIITIGNQLRSDDGVGPYIAKNVQKTRKHIHVLDARDRPEDIISGTAGIRPDRTIIIDAADFGGKPGEIRLIPEDVIPDKSLSTHSIPLRVITRILAEDTGSEVFFLGIQPGSMEFGEGLSQPIKESAAEIIKLIRQ